MHLAQATEADARQLPGHGGQRLEHRIVVKDLVVDLVAQQQQAMPCGYSHQPLQQRGRVYRTRRVVRVDQHQRTGARRDQRLDFVGVGQVAVGRGAAVIARPAAVQDCRGAPQRIVRAWQQHFVIGLQQGAQADVDQLADAVADEDALRVDVACTTGALLGGDGVARHLQALLVAVAFAFMQMAGDGPAQIRWCLEAVAAEVADIELDDFLAGRFHVARAARQCAANLVTHLGQMRTGHDGAGCD